MEKIKQGLYKDILIIKSSNFSNYKIRISITKIFNNYPISCINFSKRCIFIFPKNLFWHFLISIFSFTFIICIINNSTKSHIIFFNWYFSSCLTLFQSKSTKTRSNRSRTKFFHGIHCKIKSSYYIQRYYSNFIHYDIKRKCLLFLKFLSIN